MFLGIPVGSSSSSTVSQDALAFEGSESASFQGLPSRTTANEPPHYSLQGLFAAALYPTWECPPWPFQKHPQKALSKSTPVVIVLGRWLGQRLFFFMTLVRDFQQGSRCRKKSFRLPSVTLNHALIPSSSYIGHQVHDATIHNIQCTLPVPRPPLTSPSILRSVKPGWRHWRRTSSPPSSGRRVTTTSLDIGLIFFPDRGSYTTDDVHGINKRLSRDAEASHI